MNSSIEQKPSIEFILPQILSTTLIFSSTKGDWAHYLSHDQNTMATSHCHVNRVDILLGINKNDRIWYKSYSAHNAIFQFPIIFTGRDKLCILWCKQVKSITFHNSWYLWYFFISRELIIFFGAFLFILNSACENLRPQWPAPQVQ